MKKATILIISSFLLLSACGNQEKGISQSDIDELDKKEEKQNEKIHDPLKFAKADKNEIFISDEGMGEFKMLKKYTNSNSDKNGITPISNNGFDFNFSYMLIQDVSTEEKYLAYFGEIVNNADKRLEFLNKVKFVTDTGEQLTPEFGIGTGALNEDLTSGSKVKGFHKVKLEYADDIPKQIGVSIDKVDDNENMEHYGEVQKLQLSTDGTPKENIAKPIDM